MDILYLTLKKKWFDMILFGEKKEEYREAKPYWGKRLLYGDAKFDIVRFTNGYSPESPSMDVEFKSLEIGVGNREWGAPSEKVYIISLGNVISTKNTK